MPATAAEGVGGGRSPHAARQGGSPRYRSAADLPSGAGEGIGAALDRLVPSGLLALAVSGGPDSLALLLLAHAARPGRAIAATVDHRLRPESAGEADRVAHICRGFGVPHEVLPVTVGRHGTGLQAAAREARYAALARWAEMKGAAALATAHHLDDRAETLLMRLARGSGLGGLAGVREERPLGVRGVRLVRPLLGWRKAALIELVRAAGLHAADDPANRDARHDRTAFRALLAREPRLAPERLASAAAALADAEAALDWSARRLAAERIRVEAGVARLDVADLPRELRRRLLATLLPEARGDALARLVDRLDTGGGGTLGRRRVTAAAAVWTVSEAPPHRTR